MAIIPSSRYSGQTDSGDSAYPHGKAKNVAVSGDGTGTPLEADWVNDIWGFLQALLDRSNVTPDGSPDEVGASQYLEALDIRLGTPRNLVAANGDLMSGSWTQHHLAAATETTDPYDAVLGNGGMSLYTVDFGASSNVAQWNLSEKDNVETAVAYGEKSLGTIVDFCTAIDFSSDGTKVFGLGYDATLTQTYLAQIALSTAWDITTAAIAATHTYSFTANIVPGGAWGFRFNADGTKCYVAGSTGSGHAIYECSLSAAYDLSTLSIVGGLPIDTDANGWEGGASKCYSLALSEDGRRLYVLTKQTSGEYIWEFGLPATGALTGAVKLGRVRNITVPGDLTFRCMAFGVGDDAIATFGTYGTGSTILTMRTSTVRVG